MTCPSLSAPSRRRVLLNAGRTASVACSLSVLDRRVWDGVEAAVSTLAVRRASGENGRPHAPAARPEEGARLEIELQLGSLSEEASSAQTDAVVDGRARLVRGEAELRWTCRGYDLVVPVQGQRARIGIRRHLRPALRQQATAHALRRALLTLVPRVGCYPVHAAGLCASGRSGAVLLIGPSGSGKSTLAAGLVARGWRCLSDDLVALVPPGGDDGPVRAFGLTDGIRLRPDAWDLLSSDPQWNASRPEGAFGTSAKVRVRTGRSHPEEPRLAGRPDTVLFPVISERATSRIDPLRRSVALGRILRQMQPPAALPGPVAAAQFEAVGALLRQCRCVQLTAGRDLYTDPGRLDDQLRERAPISR